MAKDDVKYTRQELKEDEFVSFASVALEWIVKYRMQVIAALGAIVIVVAVVEAGKWWVARRNLGASDLLFKAMAVTGGDHGSGSENPVTPEKRKEAVAAFEKVISEYPSSEAANFAALQAAALHLDMGDNENAVKYSDRFISKAAADDRMRQNAVEIKGYALMNKGDAKAAAELFRSSVDAKWLVAKDQALFNLGSALAKAGDKKGAADAYRRIGAEVPKSQLKEKADARAKELDPQQPAPPPQAQ